jgi:3-deoxy-D-manno-octulosonic-acid transferase
MFAAAELICAQSQLDAQRLRNHGVDDRRITITGNLKFDVEVPAEVRSSGLRLRRQWGATRPVLIAASTHHGEEQQILAAFAELLGQFPDLLLVVVPRHPERFGAVARLCRQRGFATARRSRLDGALPPGTRVLVGDTMGELMAFYAAADIAVIGGSFIRHGGQNPLEACMLGVPVIFGPHMFHFEEISALALERGAARQVPDPPALADAVGLYLQQPHLRRAAGQAGLGLVRDNHGALERTLEALGRQLLTTARAPESAAARAASRA